MLNYFIGESEGKGPGAVFQCWTLHQSPQIRPEASFGAFVSEHFFVYFFVCFFITVETRQMEYVEFLKQGNCFFKSCKLSR